MKISVLVLNALVTYSYTFYIFFLHSHKVFNNLNQVDAQCKVQLLALTLSLILMSDVK